MQQHQKIRKLLAEKRASRQEMDEVKDLNIQMQIKLARLSNANPGGRTVGGSSTVAVATGGGGVAIPGPSSISADCDVRHHPCQSAYKCVCVCMFVVRACMDAIMRSRLYMS